MLACWLKYFHVGSHLRGALLLLHLLAMESFSPDELSRLDVSTLLHILYLVWAELHRRLVTDMSPPPPPPPSAIPSTPARTAAVPGNLGAEDTEMPARAHRPKTWRGACGEKCKYCAVPCSRSTAGHGHHSCWVHRERRD